MKNYLKTPFYFLLLINSPDLQAQIPWAEIISGKGDTLTIDYSPRKIRLTPEILQIEIIMHGKPVDYTIPFVLADNDFPNSPQIGISKITTAEWTTDGQKLKVDLQITTSSLDTDINQDYIAHIVLADTSRHEFYTIRLRPSFRYDPSKPFWIEMGSNFDLVDNIKPNNLYAAVLFYKRDIRRFHFGDKSKKIPNMGVFAGVYESKTLSTVSSSFEPRQYISSNSYSHLSDDSVYVFRDTGTVKRISEIRNVGLFFSPQIRLTRGSANEDGMHVAAGIWGEIQWQQFTNKFDIAEAGRHDTIVVDTLRARSYSPLPSETQFDMFTHYLGINAPIYMIFSDVRLFINPIIGLSNQIDTRNLQEQQISITPKSKNKWNPFYAVQFRLNEEKYGIAFSGEVRGLLINDSAPFVTLVLSKKFDLNKLISF